MDFYTFPAQPVQQPKVKANNPDFMGSQKQLEGAVDPITRTLYEFV
jgi:hypothetical protein